MLTSLDINLSIDSDVFLLEESPVFGEECMFRPPFLSRMSCVMVLAQSKGYTDVLEHFQKYMHLGRQSTALRPLSYVYFVIIAVSAFDFLFILKVISSCQSQSILICSII